ncbi:hypothetical protein B0O80DRAFT_495815 [Mortierella sp. GBAus27b]|nr:hypothetical protein B0O80DRAFT_495815 [Mortierella sp. GBAus27b]
MAFETLRHDQTYISIESERFEHNNTHSIRRNCRVIPNSLRACLRPSLVLLFNNISTMARPAYRYPIVPHPAGITPPNPEPAVPQLPNGPQHPPAPVELFMTPDVVDDGELPAAMADNQAP